MLFGLIGLLLLQQFLVWMTAVLSRVSLQTVLGEGFAPAVTRATLRSSLHLFWPVLGLSLLQGVAVSAGPVACSRSSTTSRSAALLSPASTTTVRQIVATDRRDGDRYAAMAGATATSR